MGFQLVDTEIDKLKAKPTFEIEIFPIKFNGRRLNGPGDAPFDLFSSSHSTFFTAPS